MEIPEKLKLEYLLALDNHIETVGKDNKEVTMKKIFEITKEIADLGFGEEDILAIAKDEDLYLKYEKWRDEKNQSKDGIELFSIQSKKTSSRNCIKSLSLTILFSLKTPNSIFSS